MLFAPRPLARLNEADRVRACYQHACLKFVSHSFLTNTSVRERFGLEEKQAAFASRLIREAVASGLIAPVDADAGKRNMKYQPSWAAGLVKE